MEDSSKSKLYFYNWSEKESENLLSKYNCNKLGKVEKIHDLAIISNSYSTNNIITFHSGTMVTIFGKVSCC